MASGDRQNTSPKRSGKKKKMSQAEQSERFKETARTIEADESGKSFRNAFDAIAKQSGVPKADDEP